MSIVKTIYRIRRRGDGLFSTGGAWPSFKAKGKQWPSKAALHSHFNMVFGHLGQGRGGCYADCEIVEFEITEREGAASDLSKYQAHRVEQLQEKAKVKEQRRMSKTCPTCERPLHAKACA